MDDFPHIHYVVRYTATYAQPEVDSILSKDLRRE